MQQDVRDILRRHGFRFTHKLGQNFLFDPALLARMAEASGIEEGACVLEIGPGAGTLTRAISEKIGPSGKVLAVELDEKLLPVLGETLGAFQNVRIVHGDVLKADLEGLTQETFGRPFSVVANLPYYITTPVIFRFLESAMPIKRLLVMVQKEVALRMTAQPGSEHYGVLSLSVQFHTIPTRVMEVPAGAFTPPPKVDSSVVLLQMRETPPVDVSSPQAFLFLVRAAFQMRRKTILNNLLASYPLSRDQATDALEKSGISSTARGETFSMETFAVLLKQIEQQLSAKNA